MRKPIIILLLVIAIGPPTAWLSASPLDDKVAALREAMKTEIADKESKSAASGVPVAPGDALLRYPGAVEVLLSNLNDASGSTNAQAELQQLLSQFSSDAVQKAGHDLLDEIRRERQAKVDTYTSSVDDVIKRVSDAVLKATKPSDLDQVLADLQRVQQGGRENPGMYQEMQRATQRALSAYQFVAIWQDYLSDSENGKIQQAQNELHGLAQNNYGESLIPRSAILDRANQLAPSVTTSPGGAPLSSGETARKIVEGIQSLDDMAPALQRISAQDPNDNGGIIQTLRGFVTEYNNTKAGLPLAFNFGSPVFQPEFNNPKLYTKLWLFLLEHEFDAFKGTPPAEGESPLQFLECVFADAEQREDWHELQQAYLAHAYLQRNSLFSTGLSPRDTTGFEFMLAGLNQETAGQYVASILSFEQALKFPDTYLPAKFIGNRLNNIQKNHPDDYAKALQLAGLAPTATAPTNSGVPLPPH